jgi:2-methyl-3-hydroxypyridine 5-carboxylic acid dioxygenase
MQQHHAEIAGGGFAGLTAAIALAQRGWSVRVHEMAAEPRAFGAGIFLWENGLEVLRLIGAYDAVMANAFEAPRFDDFNAAGELIFSKSLPIPQGSRMVTMTRQDLYAPILAVARQMGVQIVTGSEATDATPAGELVLANGQRFKADLVIAADGIRSSIRRNLKLEQEHIVFPVGIYRTLIPRSAEEVQRPEWNAYVNFWSDRRRVLYVPCTDKELYVLLAAKLPDEDGSLVQPISVEIWTRTFPMLASVFDRIGSDLYYNQYEVLRCKKWSSGRVAIIGDAAHAMPPTMGQGAGSAMMNAMMLAKELDKSATIEEALERWEAVERPVTEHTQTISVTRAKDWMPGPQSRRATWSDDDLKPAMHLSSQRA